MNCAERVQGRRSRRSFTLIEVAVSIAILGGVIAGMLVARGRALANSRAAQEIMTCTRLCASRVAAFRAGLVAEGEGAAAHASGYSLRITRGTLPDDAPPGLEAYEISVTAPPSLGENAGSVTVVVWRRSAEQSEKSE